MIGIFGSVDGSLHVYVAPSEAVLNAWSRQEASTSGVFFSFRDSSDVFRTCGCLSGHEEWVTDIASVFLSEDEVMVASSSQDCKIRIWRLKMSSSSGPEGLPSVDRVDVAVDDDEQDDEGEEGEVQVRLSSDDLEDEECRLLLQTSKGFTLRCFLESLLLGHEDWVTSVHWLPANQSTVRLLRF